MMVSRDGIISLVILNLSLYVVTSKVNSMEVDNVYTDPRFRFL